MTQLVSNGLMPQASFQDRELHDAIALLDPKYSAVINMYYFEGMNYESIAIQMGKPIGTIKGWMNRAKKQLRKEMV